MERQLVLTVFLLSVLGAGSVGLFRYHRAILPGKGDPDSTYAELKGDLTIGGLFPVHNKGQGGKPCGKLNSDRGIQRLEAMLYAIKEINSNTSLLPGITLGAHILDTCARDTYALEQSLEFVRNSLTNIDIYNGYYCDDGSQAKITNMPAAVTAVVGASDSSVSGQVANLLRLFRIPQVSYASTSAKLSDKTRFDYFARTVPPDTFQAKAMVEIIQIFNWTYVSTVASEGDYGEMGIDMFKKEALARNICIAAEETIPNSANDDTFDLIVERLREKSNAKVVVLFIKGSDVPKLLSAAKNLTDPFVWIASDGWGEQEAAVKNVEDVAEGAITIELSSKPIKAFNKYFKNLTPDLKNRNPWFNEYWEDKFFCRLPYTKRENSSFPVCDIGLTNKKFEPESKIQFVVDAVYAIAYALDNVRKEVCGTPSGMCSGLRNLDGARLYKAILNVTFQDVAKRQVQFDERGDGMGRYDIYNFQRVNGDWKYVPVGHWLESLYLDETKIQVNSRLGSLPESRCSAPCRPNEAKIVQQGDNCCWICKPCQPRQYLIDEHTCEDCGFARWPTFDLKTCHDLPEKYLQPNEVWALVPMIIALLGIMMTGAVIAVFMKYNDTPLVKASSRELSYMLLGGLVMCFVMTFVIIAKPSVGTCALVRLGLGLSFTVCYTALLTKTNRIYRIFTRQTSTNVQKVNYISPISQLLICTALISVQAVGVVVWLAVEPPDTQLVYPFGRQDQVILKCKIKDKSLMMSLVYVMLLIIVCTIYAFKTRKVPDNFNETKYIGFTMYTTCIVWLAFVPIYFGTQTDHRIQTTTMCIAVSISAFVALGCLFAPKVYIILFQPEKNVRSMNRQKPSFKSAVMFAKERHMAGALNGPGQGKPPLSAMIQSKNSDNPSSDNGLLKSSNTCTPRDVHVTWKDLDTGKDKKKDLNPPKPYVPPILPREPLENMKIPDRFKEVEKFREDEKKPEDEKTKEPEKSSLNIERRSPVGSSNVKQSNSSGLDPEVEKIFASNLKRETKDFPMEM
ncbi:metabotropic glutamate receptor 3-like isoform X1 [Branchiostoma floridae x Branchiostoma belcheri]